MSFFFSFKVQGSVPAFTIFTAHIQLENRDEGSMGDTEEKAVVGFSSVPAGDVLQPELLTT